MKTNTKTICHRDHTITYWSVSAQSWRRRVLWISDADLAALPSADRERAIRHLK